MFEARLAAADAGAARGAARGRARGRPRAAVGGRPRPAIGSAGRRPSRRRSPRSLREDVDRPRSATATSSSTRCCASGSRARRSDRGSSSTPDCTRLERALLFPAPMTWQCGVLGERLVRGHGPVRPRRSPSRNQRVSSRVGAQLSTTQPPWDQRTPASRRQPPVAIGQSKTGWGWHYGLNWFDTDLERARSAAPTPSSVTLRVRSAHGGLRLHPRHRPYRGHRRS